MYPGIGVFLSIYYIFLYIRDEGQSENLEASDTSLSHSQIAQTAQKFPFSDNFLARRCFVSFSASVYLATRVVTTIRVMNASLKSR